MRKILVVDHDQRMTRLLAMTLPDDHEVLQAMGGDGAVDIVETRWPDLMMDMNMQGSGGSEVLRMVKQSPVLKKMRVIRMTARFDEVDKALGLRLKADGYPTKPSGPLAPRGEVSRHGGEA